MIEEQNGTKPASLREANVLQKMIFFFVLVAALFVIIFASPIPFFSEKQARAALGTYSRSFAAYTHENGADGRLAFGSVKIVGSTYAKKAQISNFQLTLSHTPWLGNDTLTISSPVVDLVPSPSGMGQPSLEFPAPVAIALNGAPAYTVSFPSGPAPSYTATPVHGAKGAVFDHSLRLPPKMLLAVPGSKDAPTVITYNPDPTISCTHDKQGDKSNSLLAFQNVSITGPKTSTTIGAVSSRMEHQLAGGGKIGFDVNVALSDIGFKGEHGMEGPYSFHLSAAGTRIAPAAGKLPPPDTDVTLRELSLSADKFHLTATGSMSRKADDPLPFGKADVNVDNFSSLRGSSSLSPETKAMLVDAATHITGTDASTADKFSFVIKRDKLGQLMIGNSGFAELATSILSRMVLGAPVPAPAATAPAALAPAAAAPAAAPAPAAAAKPATVKPK